MITGWFPVADNARKSQRIGADIAHDSGYCDQMHAVHEFKRFSRESPTRLWVQACPVFPGPVVVVGVTTHDHLRRPLVMAYAYSNDGFR